MKPTQQERVKNRLLAKGEITRNEALRVYISRLAAIIANLQKEGMNITGEWRKHANGKDYVYKYHAPDTLF